MGIVLENVTPDEMCDLMCGEPQDDEIDINITPLYTSVSARAAERIKNASWEQIESINDPGFQIIAMTLKDRQKKEERNGESKD